MKPSKQPSLSNQPQQQADITDIAEIFQKLNNRSSVNIAKPYSQYDAESIFPPPSQISLNPNDNESQKSKSNCFLNLWKRTNVCESKQEKELGFSAVRFEQGTKKIKKIQVEKVNINMQSSVSNLVKEEQLSNKESLLNLKNKDLIPLQSPSANFKITDFFVNKKQKLQKPKVKQTKLEYTLIKEQLQSSQNQYKIHSFSQLQQPKTNPIISSLMQKNNKRRKTIQELKQQIQALNLRKQESFLKFSKMKKEQKQKLRIKLLETNEIKMQFHKFNSQMRSILIEDNLKQQILPQIKAKLKNLEEQKKKNTSKKGTTRKQIHTDEQSIGNTDNRQNPNPHQIPDKKNYINQWVSKLQKCKEKLQSDKTYYERLFKTNNKIQNLTEEIANAFNENVLLKDYVLLSMEYPFASCKANADETVEINSFNLQLLRSEILTLIKYPKFSSLLTKQTVQKEISNLFKMSKKLHNSASFYFLQTTIATQAGQNNEFIVYGRQRNEEFQPLTAVLNKYDNFSQVMVRYIARVCLIALEEIKVKVDRPCFLLPTNIYFTQKYDIKFSNILMNNLFLNQEFKPYLKEEGFYYFVAPEAMSQKDFSNLSIWSLGVLLYFIIYEKYPFQYEFETSFLKETFFIYNQLTFPAKPSVNQKVKDFISVCLTGKEKDLGQLQKHQFFHK